MVNKTTFSFLDKINRNLLKCKIDGICLKVQGLEV